jgi:predicted metal-binding protein
MKKIGILACENFMLKGCPGTDVCWKCFDFAINKKGQFSRYGEEKVQVTAMATCGGCPGTRVVKRGMMLAKQNVDVIHIAGCIVQEIPCPYFKNEEIAKVIEDKTGIPVVIGIE